MADPVPTPAPAPTDPAFAHADGAPVAPNDGRSVGDLLSELSHETTTLLKQEVRLAKAEARQEAHEAGAAIGSAVAGGAVAYTGLIALVIGLGWGLGQLFDDDLIWLGITLAGVIVAVVGYLMLQKGLDKVRALSAPPLDTTTQTLREDKQWLKQETP